MQNVGEQAPRRTASFVWIAFFLAIYIALAVHSEYWLGVVTTHPIGDDFKIYYGAYQKALAGENPYEPYGIGSGYIYHPAALTFVSLFTWSGSQWFSTYLWIGLSGVAWGVSIWLGLKLARIAWADEYGIEAASERSWFVVTLLVGFAPFWESLHIGQVNPFVVLCLVLALYFAKNDRPFAGGFALALAIVLKTSPIVLLAYFVVMQRFRAAFWTVLCLVALSAVAVVQFSPVLYTQFWEILPRLGAELHPDSYNQSILSVTFRTFPGPGEPGAWVLAYRVASALMIAVLLIVGWLNYRRDRKISTWLYMALIAAVVFFAPLVWYHHSTLLLLPLTALLISPISKVFWTGVGLMFVIQAERLFEQLITLTAYPIVAVHIGLMMLLCFLYLKRPRFKAA